MALTVSDLVDLADLFLEKRLTEFTAALERCQEEMEAGITGGGRGAMARGHLVGAWTRAYEQHCEQVLADLVGLMRTFGAFTAAESIRDKLESHFTGAADELGESLQKCGFGGVGSVSAEQKRVANLVSGVKRRAHQEWDREIARTVRERERAASLVSSADDLDDRLPLNRRGAFDRDLPLLAKPALSEEGEAPEPLGLIMIDIDHFKRVNDQHGHPVGDEVLLEVAQLVVGRVAHKGKSYRYGGEELAVLLPTYSTEETAGLAERLRKDLQAARVSSKNLQVTASFGVASLPADAADPKGLLERADTALYEAKRSGRNQVCSAL